MTAAAPEAQLDQLRLADDASPSTTAPAAAASTTTATTTAATTAPPFCRPQPSVCAFSERTPDGTAVLHYQLVDLGAQLYVWIGGGGAGLPTVPNLLFAIASGPRQQEPAVAALLPDRDAGGRAEALSRRLARRLGRPVLLSCALPAGSDPLLHALAERRLLQELKDMGLLAAAAGAATGGGGTAAASASAGG